MLRSIALALCLAAASAFSPAQLPLRTRQVATSSPVCAMQGPGGTLGKVKLGRRTCLKYVGVRFVYKILRTNCCLRTKDYFSTHVYFSSLYALLSFTYFRSSIIHWLVQGAVAAALLFNLAAPVAPAFADTAVNPYAKVTCCDTFTRSHRKKSHERNWLTQSFSIIFRLASLKPRRLPLKRSLAVKTTTLL
jgi:hypothetical protein